MPYLGPLAALGEWSFVQGWGIRQSRNTSKEAVIQKRDDGLNQSVVASFGFCTTEALVLKLYISSCLMSLKLFLSFVKKEKKKKEKKRGQIRFWGKYFEEKVYEKDRGMKNIETLRKNTKGNIEIERKRACVWQRKETG